MRCYIASHRLTIISKCSVAYATLKFGHNLMINLLLVLFDASLLAIYRVFDIEKHHIFTSRDVTFHEKEFPFPVQQPDEDHVITPIEYADDLLSLDSHPKPVVAQHDPNNTNIHTSPNLDNGHNVVPNTTAVKQWELHQLYVNNAFLHGDLHEEAYRQWFAKFTQTLIAIGFKQSIANYLLFTSQQHNSYIAVLAYVDDLIITGDDPACIKSLKNNCFKTKDLGPLRLFLGIEISKSNEGMFLCQYKYIMDILTKTGMQDCKLCSTPMEQQKHLIGYSNLLLSDPARYRKLVGRLVYLTITWPELSFDVHTLSQFMHEPHQEHLDAAIQVVRYLKDTPTHGVLLSSTNDFILRGFCDSDWASCPLTRRSTTGYITMLGESPISWKTKKQHTVSRSSTEAEYWAMAVLATELL
ncbi:PREDICTED: uncharacterized protein LOC109115255 [Nelumbo nucifera]|uniref:Uncharacterized protein LOC109115255 n=1 Tax=Nelumbo nucifera TaxID=4432 RepID=A0A1U8Q732_NELNU|nr:PREDICTED: uncharacterized protein LOC109115255 [Nelumbo nucifera]